MIGAPELPPLTNSLLDDFKDFDDQTSGVLESKISMPPCESPTDDTAETDTIESDPELEQLLESIGNRAEITESTGIQMTYAEKQLTREIAAKRLVARWISEQIPLRDDTSLYVDAGSQCLLAWRAIAPRLRQANFSKLNVVTFNQAILESWSRNEDGAQIFAPKLVLAGKYVNPGHRAFFGAERNQLATFCPSVTLVGTNGIRVGSGGIHIAFNCDDPELEDKRLQFRLGGGTHRVVLLTASKIGETGARAFDLLDLSDFDSETPIYFVTNEPTPGGVYRDALDKLLSNMQSPRLQKRLLEKDIKIYWVIVRDSGQGPLAFDIKAFPDSDH